MHKEKTLHQALEEASQTLDAVRSDRTCLAAVEAFATAAVDCLQGGGHIYACGNGGSMTDAMHFAQECTGRFRRSRAALAATALSDPSQLTCIANDFGFEEVFARQVEAAANSRDLLVLISTSGESENIVRAAETAKAIGVPVVLLTGRDGGRALKHADVAIIVPRAETSDRIQEVHALLLHAVIEMMEEKLFGEIPDDRPGR